MNYPCKQLSCTGMRRERRNTPNWAVGHNFWYGQKFGSLSNSVSGQSDNLTQVQRNGHRGACGQEYFTVHYKFLEWSTRCYANGLGARAEWSGQTGRWLFPRNRGFRCFSEFLQGRTGGNQTFERPHFGFSWEKFHTFGSFFTATCSQKCAQVRLMTLCPGVRVLSCDNAILSS